MSKYKRSGAYHFKHFETPGDIYREHVLDLLRVVPQFLPEKARILDVGCGEGLILSQFRKLGYDVIGVDVDRFAVDLAKGKGLPVHPGSIDVYREDEFDAVFLLDCLEHMEDYEKTLRAAELMADVIVIALPSEHDRHAVCTPSLRSFGSETWELMHSEVRHARFLTIWRRKHE